MTIKNLKNKEEKDRTKGKMRIKKKKKKSKKVIGMIIMNKERKLINKTKEKCKKR